MEVRNRKKVFIGIVLVIGMGLLAGVYVMFKSRTGIERPQKITDKSARNTDLRSTVSVKSKMSMKDRASRQAQRSGPGTLDPVKPVQGRSQDFAQQMLSSVLDKDTDQVRVSLQQLVEMGDAAVPDLKRLLTDGPGPDVMEFAALALARIGTVDAVSVLLEGIRQTTEPGLRENLTRALAEIQGTKSAGILLDVLLQEEAGVLRNGIRDAVARIADTEVVKSLVSAYYERAESKWQERNLLATISRVRSNSAIPALADILVEESSVSLRMQAAMTLGAIGNKDAVYALASAIEDSKSDGLVSTYGQAMASISDKDTESLLIKYINESRNQYLRIGSALALGNIPTKFVKAELENALDFEQSQEVRKAIEHSLNKIRQSLGG